MLIPRQGQELTGSPEWPQASLHTAVTFYVESQFKKSFNDYPLSTNKVQMSTQMALTQDDTDSPSSFLLFC